MKKVIALILVLVMALSMVACGGAKKDDGQKTIGILMPTKEQTIWSIQGERLVAGYEAAGYATEIEYAEDDSARQAMQIENMISKGVDALIVVAVDGAALTDACEKAKEAGILVIAEDRLITNTDAVDYYVTFDLVKMGGLQGQFIADALDLENAAGPFNLEIFSGSQDDPNAALFYQGAMEVLNPYIDSGKLVIQSGQVDYSVTAIQGWDSAKAQSRMDNLLSGYYADKHLDAVLVAADCLAIGVISSLESMGYGTADNPFPIVTGQDCELAAIKNIKAGKQTMSVFIDGTLLAAKTVELLDSINAGAPIAPDSTTNNEVFDVPTMLYDPLPITAENYTHLIEVGFYTDAEVNG